VRHKSILFEVKVLAQILLSKICLYEVWNIALLFWLYRPAWFNRQFSFVYCKC